MNILLLGPQRVELQRYLESFGDTVHQTQDKITATGELLHGADFILSYGYRHIIKKDIIAKFPHRIINLHIAYLPWNRGADPNLWSFLDDTPKGVTIHYIDEGIDTGNILAQKEVDSLPNDTFRTSYDRLANSIKELFYGIWPQIRESDLAGTAQPDGGTFHRLKDKDVYSHLLTQGWDTPVASLIGITPYAKQKRQYVYPRD